MLGVMKELALGGPIHNGLEIDGNLQEGAAAGLDWCCLGDGTCAGVTPRKII